jgi:hypothetical protein
VQLRLSGFDRDRLVELGQRVRELYVLRRPDAAHIEAVVDDVYVADFAHAVTGELGGNVGVAPRIFLKKLVDVLQRVDLHRDFDPRRDYPLTFAAGELRDVERNAAAGLTADDIKLDLASDGD